MLLLIFILLLGAGLYAWFVEPAQLVITNRKIAADGQVSGRFLFLSDLHLGRFTGASRLKKMILRLRLYLVEHPVDIILLGGDYLDSDSRYLPELALVLEALRALELPTYAVLGNHDYLSCSPIDPLLQVLRDGGCIVLRNEAVSLTLNGKALMLVGVDDLEEAPGYRNGLRFVRGFEYRELTGKLDWYSSFDTANPSLPRLLLTHNPDSAYLPGLTPLGVLAGHTHGGQLLPIDLLGRFATRLVHIFLPAGSFRTKAGQLQANGRKLIISRGLGGSAIPARFLRRPEAIIIDIS